MKPKYRDVFKIKILKCRLFWLSFETLCESFEDEVKMEQMTLIVFEVKLINK